MNKLSLNRETLLHLDVASLPGVAGAGSSGNIAGCVCPYTDNTVTDCLVSTNPYNCFKTNKTLNSCV